MAWLYTLFYTLLAIALFPYILGLFLPRRFTISREVIVRRPIGEAFAFMRLLKNQERYSTYAQADPDVKIEYGGTDGTVGAVATWDSRDRSVGRSEQEIKAIEDGKRIELEIRYHEPFQSTEPLVMEFEALGPDQTRIRNIYRGKIRYPYNLLVWWVMAKARENMQASLDNVKTLLESQATQR